MAKVRDMLFQIFHRKSEEEWVRDLMRAGVDPVSAKRRARAEHNRLVKQKHSDDAHAVRYGQSGKRQRMIQAFYASGKNSDPVAVEAFAAELKKLDP